MERNYTIILAGNPNVGKSTVFNALTGMKQHTGNWAGKTVGNATASFKSGENNYTLTDIPGTYSLFTHSAEEEAARDCICFENADMVVVVCDATCLERNLNLVLQIIEISPKVMLCLNLVDEAERKKIKTDTARLSELLGVPVVSVTARKRKGVAELVKALDSAVDENLSQGARVKYPNLIEDAIFRISANIEEKLGGKLNPRWVSLRLLDADESFIEKINNYLAFDISKEAEATVSKIKNELKDKGIGKTDLGDLIATSIVYTAECISDECTIFEDNSHDVRDRKIDKIFTGKIFAFPIMLFMLAVIFWLTVTGANYPSQLLSSAFSALGENMSALLIRLNTPEWLRSVVTDGVYRVLSWVVAVMLPPTAIFFFLFNLLEDAGFLPRIAYNLDRPFHSCNACGKQALTMCMGFGCNAVGVSGAKIIDSERERLLAVLTNSLVPCNGRFPALISVITMFFVGTSALSSVWSAALLTIVIFISVAMTLLVTKILSITVLKGAPSAFTIELPSYRVPQFGKVAVNSVFEKTLSVLGRAVSVAAPAGLVIWLMANVSIGGEALLHIFSSFLDPFAHHLGLDGVILMSFILGFPANEIVLPIALMAYTADSSISELASLEVTKDILVANGWTWQTAVSFILFSLMHWPCSTTVLTVKKETVGLKWTILSMMIPTAVGIATCAVFNLIA